MFGMLASFCGLVAGDNVIGSGVDNGPPIEKMNAISLVALSVESLPCTALRVPSIPKMALILSGRSTLALIELVGPIRKRQALIADTLLKCKATIGPDVM